jgi:hypothetical protein
VRPAFPLRPLKHFVQVGSLFGQTPHMPAGEPSRRRT